MPKNIQIPIELFDDLVILLQGINQNCDMDSPLFKQLLERITAGVREKRKSIALRKLYKEAIAEGKNHSDGDAYKNYRNTKYLWKHF